VGKILRVVNPLEGYVWYCPNLRSPLPAGSVSLVLTLNPYSSIAHKWQEVHCLVRRDFPLFLIGKLLSFRGCCMVRGRDRAGSYCLDSTDGASSFVFQIGFG
jgi:hypothetical protein